MPAPPTRRRVLPALGVRGAAFARTRGARRRVHITGAERPLHTPGRIESPTPRSPIMDVVFDADHRYGAFHDAAEDTLVLAARCAAGPDGEAALEGGFGVDLGPDAHLALDEDDAVASLELRGAAGIAALGLSASEVEALRAPDTLPDAELADAFWRQERPLRWAVDGARLVVVLEGARRTQWARLGRSGLCVALDLEGEQGAEVAALAHGAVTPDPALAQLTAWLGEDR